MEFVKNCKRVWGSSKRLYPEDSGSGSGNYSKVSEKHEQKRDKNKNKKPKVAPHGRFCVYVGPERQRFVIMIKIANHPLFKTLLDAAENEYGYSNDGPLWLPCNVDLFCEALEEMDDDMGYVGCTTFPMGHNKHSSSSISRSSLSYRSNLSCAVRRLYMSSSCN